MVSKAIIELNACVSALRRRRLNGDFLYHDILTDKEMSKIIRDDIRELKWIVVEDLLDKATKGTYSDLYNDADIDRFIRSYVIYPEIYDGNHIANGFVDYFHGTLKECRRCSVCGRLIQEGYCEDSGWRYYCSEECLHTKYSDAEWEEECENNEDSYWTTWY